MYTHMQACLQTRMQAYTHTHTHTHTYAWVGTCMSNRTDRDSNNQSPTTPACPVVQMAAVVATQGAAIGEEAAVGTTEAEVATTTLAEATTTAGRGATTSTTMMGVWEAAGDGEAAGAGAHTCLDVSVCASVCRCVCSLILHKIPARGLDLITNSILSWPSLGTRSFTQPHNSLPLPIML